MNAMEVVVEDIVWSWWQWISEEVGGEKSAMLGLRKEDEMVWAKLKN